MQTALLNKICIVRAKEGINGYPACLALLKRAMVKSNLDVHSLLFLNLRRELPSLFRDNQRFNAIQCLDVNSLEEVRTRLDAQNISKNSLIFIDSLSLLIEQFSLPSTSWLLNQLSELSTCVLALIGSGLEEDLDIWRRVEFISTTIFQLETAEDSDVLLCRTIDRKKDETFETKFEQFTIRPDYSIEASPYVEPDTATKILKEVQLLSLQQQQEKDKASQEGGAGSKFGFDKLPFDVGLNLSEQERRAKANLQLPYMAAQSQKGLVGMNISSGKKLRAGGQIIYTPDKEDDFDESDPDDDLAI